MATQDIYPYAQIDQWVDEGLVLRALAARCEWTASDTRDLWVATDGGTVVMVLALIKDRWQRL